MEGLVSIIILNYKNYSDTIKCLESLVNSSYKNFEVIIIDNGSPEHVFIKFKEKLSPFNSKLNYKVIRSAKNLFFTGGNNKAIKFTKGDYICLLNNDTIVLPNFLKTMIDFLEKNPDAGMICPKIKHYKYKSMIWYAGAKINFKNPFIVEIIGQREFDISDSKYNTPIITDFAVGTALFLRKQVVSEIGLLDDIYFIYQEDPDWNLRLKMKNYKSYYVPKTIVYHNIKIPIKKGRLYFRKFMIRRNSQILAWKFANIKQLIIFYVIYLFTMTKEIGELLIFYKFKKPFLLYLYIMAIWQGFRIGLKRKTNRSCKKILLKDYKFISKIQKKLNSYRF
ncbi:MAG: glycosyltransferase family 2 protein [Promethearchaeota archaeon]